MPGEMDEGGLAMRLPVEGFTMGMALVRERMAEGWWILRLLLLLVYVGGDIYADVVAEEIERAGVICCGCICDCKGDESGEPLDKEERSEDPEATDCRFSKSVRDGVEDKSSPPTSSNVRRFGQNSRSSSRSNDRPASNLARYAVMLGASTITISLTILGARNWRWEF